jgi:CBS domain-containing protein
MESMPRKPSQELLMAIAGPAVNFVIAVLLGVLAASLMAAGALGDLMRLGELMGQPTWQTLLLTLLATNLLLGAFNLIPAFPMDGGRVLRALLAMVLPYLRATRIAVVVGQGLALVLGLAGLLIPGQMTLVLVAIFVFLGAGQEGQATAARELLGDLRVYQAVSRSGHVVAPWDRLARVVDLTLSTHQADFMVIEDGVLVGVLSRDAVLSGLRKHGPDVEVGRVMCSGHPTVGLNDTLLDAQQVMSSVTCQALPVVESGRPVGLLTLADINEAYTMMAISPQTFEQPELRPELRS